MSRNIDWLKSLPKTIECNVCGKMLDLPFWQHTTNGKLRIAMNFVKCFCGNINIGVAGADRKSLEAAIAIRQNFINEANSVIKH
jgi:hypothetical protein